MPQSRPIVRARPPHRAAFVSGDGARVEVEAFAGVRPQPGVDGLGQLRAAERLTWHPPRRDACAGGAELAVGLGHPPSVTGQARSVRDVDLLRDATRCPAIRAPASRFTR